MLEITPIAAFKDNYIWLLINSQLGEVIAVDPGDADLVLSYLREHELKLVAIFLTHKHADHTSGVEQLQNAYPGIPVYAHPIEKIVLATHAVKQDDILTVHQWPIAFRVIHLPGHTLGHVAYYAAPILFSGDTLFGAGCGRIFEGSAAEMYSSLAKLTALPEETLIYCGHEYTLENLRFALQVEPNNQQVLNRMALTEALCSKQHPSLPSTLGTEKLTNPFLRCTQKTVIESVQFYTNRQLQSVIEVFYELREWKNRF